MKRALWLTLGLVAAACDRDPAGADLNASRVLGQGGGVTAMTRNLYVGADLDPIIAATDPNQIPLLAAAAFQQMLQTNFPLRAGLLADEIARSRPHLIGLQEVSLIRLQDPSDLVVGGTTPATQVFLDFLPILLAELQARGLDYRVVASVENLDVEVPMVTSATPTFADVRLTDHDVLLARGDVATANAVGTRYQAALPVPGTGIVVTRGYVAADATIAGRTYRVVSTHLESAFEPVRAGQAQELIATLAGETRPIIMMGDFNTDAETLGPTYQLLLIGGYNDAWLRRLGAAEQGLTCCHLADLSNTTQTFDERIDLVFTRNLGLGPVQGLVTGDDPGERSGGLWASDHGGVVVRLVGQSIR
jgi:endonuclease/exonuclease/phosphatase family metal-dependent hydrolase